jgi:hypothetical protein
MGRGCDQHCEPSASLAEVVRRAQLSDLNRMATGEMRQRLCKNLKITSAELAERHQKFHKSCAQKRSAAD